MSNCHIKQYQVSFISVPYRRTKIQSLVKFSTLLLTLLNTISFSIQEGDKESFSLTIQADHSKDNYPQQAKHKRIKEGEDLDLPCPVQAPNIKDIVFTWTCDDEPANLRSSRIQITENGKLRILSAKVNDSCNYRCESANGFGTWSFYVRLTVVAKDTSVFTEKIGQLQTRDIEHKSINTIHLTNVSKLDGSKQFSLSKLLITTSEPFLEAKKYEIHRNEREGKLPTVNLSMRTNSSLTIVCSFKLYPSQPILSNDELLYLAQFKWLKDGKESFSDMKDGDGNNSIIESNRRPSYNQVSSQLNLGPLDEIDAFDNFTITCCCGDQQATISVYPVAETMAPKLLSDNLANSDNKVLTESQEPQINVRLEPSVAYLSTNASLGLSCHVRYPALLIGNNSMEKSNLAIQWLKEYIGQRPDNIVAAHEEDLFLFDDTYYHLVAWPRRESHESSRSIIHSALYIKNAKFAHSGKYICLAAYHPSTSPHLVHAMSIHPKKLNYASAIAQVFVNDKEGEDKFRVVKSTGFGIGLFDSSLQGILTLTSFILLLISVALLAIFTLKASIIVLRMKDKTDRNANNENQLSNHSDIEENQVTRARDEISQPIKQVNDDNLYSELSEVCVKYVATSSNMMNSSPMNHIPEPTPRTSLNTYNKQNCLKTDIQALDHKQRKETCDNYKMPNIYLKHNLDNITFVVKN